jgi:hypothetical protein
MGAQGIKPGTICNSGFILMADFHRTDSFLAMHISVTAGIRYGDDDLIKREVLEDRMISGEERVSRPIGEVVERDSVKNEIKNNIEKVKESVRQMESDVEKLGRKEF